MVYYDTCCMQRVSEVYMDKMARWLLIFAFTAIVAVGAPEQLMGGDAPSGAVGRGGPAEAAGLGAGGGKALVDIPLVGTVDASKMSLPLLTVIIGGLDGFNPCAFFVLFFLLSILVHARSRKRMFLIGATFVLFSGLFYFVFMAAWLNVFLLIGNLPAITFVAGLVAVVIASINVKDFFFFKKGVSLTISDEDKPKLFERMRGLLKSVSLSSMFAGAVVLAVAANSYELLCTAGFPLVFTRALTLHNLQASQYYLYLLLYNVVYVMPLAAIVVAFTVTLGAKKLSERQGRELKLVSGLMMLAMGIVLLVNPALLNNALMAVLLLAVTLVAAGITIFLTDRFAPEVFGAGR